MRGDPATTTHTEYFAFSGGLDLVTPHLSLAKGSVLDAVNYEPGLYGGYRQINGFERFDGRLSPSDQNYYLLEATISGTIAVGNTVTGGTSGATAVVLQVNGTTELIITKIAGTFQNGETLKVGGTVQATTTSLASSNSATTSDLDNSYRIMAADNYRADIQAVPGSGSIRGVWVYNDIIYAFRDNVGATAGVMWKSSVAGWIQVALGFEIAFTAGTGQINVGDTIVGGTSGATGVVTRVQLETGVWGSSAAGHITLLTITGTFSAAELLKVATVAKATCSGSQSAITLPAGGRYEFINYNFTGSTSTYRMYGCNGVGNAFEFDGTTFSKIRTGMTIDTPSFIAAHRLHLFLAFNGSLQHSAPGLPYQWSVVIGAGELGLGDTITGLLPQPGNATTASMLVTTRHQSYMLYGTSVANWVLSLYAQDAGGIPYTAQNVGTAFFMDDRGLVRLGTTQQFGNFEQATISRKVQPFIDANKGLVTASSIVRSKNQYRLYLSTGRVLVVAVSTNQSSMGAMVSGYSFTFIDYGTTKPVRCIVSAEKSNGTEATFFGSDDGYIYQAEKGFTFDGVAMARWLRFPFNHSKSPRIRKRYRKAVFEMSSEGQATIQLAADFSYGDTDISVGNTTTPITSIGLGGYWDTAIWDQFYWDARSIVNVPEIGLTGTGTNISLMTYSATKEPSHTLQGVILHYTPRRLTR